MAHRPTRLGRLFLWSGGLLLAASFISGLVLCIAESMRQNSSVMPTWQNSWRITHGLLTPFICIFFGYLWSQHIPGGWKMGAARISGSIVVAFMGLLILSSLGLYYANPREVYYWIHGITGLALPIAIACHWWSSRRWVRQLETRPNS